MCEAPVVIRQVLALEILVGALISPDLLAPQFLHQPVLMCPVIALHPSFGRVRQLQRIATVPTVPLKSSILTIH